jgi:transcriptional regulator with XRE-family HTH domain
MYIFRFKLNEVRKFKRITQKRLANLSKISQSHISDLERGTQSPSLKTVESLAHALKTHPSDLLEIKENH